MVRGFEQRQDIDYTEIFAPVIRVESIRILLAYVAVYDLECHQMDIETAFLNGTIEEDIM